MSRILALAAVLCLSPLTLSAQVEFGVDGGLEVESFAEGADNLTVVSFPSNQFRFGFWTNPTVGVEIRTSVFRQSQGNASATLFALGGAVRVRLEEEDREGGGPFFRAGAGLTYRSFETSDTRFFVTGGVGLDIPVAEPLDVRLEARYRRHFESDDFFASNTFAALIGLTVTVPGR